jgi:hypothetical protein
MIIKLTDYSDEYKEIYNKYVFKNSKINKNIIDEYIDNKNIHLQLNKKTIDNFEKNKYASTYGELTLNGMKTIMKKIKKYLDVKNIRFIDLGSGLGKLPIIMCYHFNAKKCTGIELSTERHNNAMEMYNKLDPNLQQKINYINDDIFNNKLGSYLSEYNFIFISNLCFSQELNKKLVVKLQECKSGTNILCSKALEADYLKLIDKFQVEMSWSDNSIIHHYIKII